MSFRAKRSKVEFKKCLKKYFSKIENPTTTLDYIKYAKITLKNVEPINSLNF